MFTRDSRGFTLIELMIVVVIIGILAAIAIPNFIAMQNRAKEGATKTNMHTVQLAAEDFGIQNDGAYADQASQVLSLLPAGGVNFANPFDQSTGSGGSWEDRGSVLSPLSASSRPGIVSYADSSRRNYNVRGMGKISPLTLVLSSGQ